MWLSLVRLTEELVLGQRPEGCVRIRREKGGMVFRWDKREQGQEASEKRRSGG